MRIHSLEEISGTHAANRYGGLDIALEAAGLSFLDWHVREDRAYASPGFLKMLGYEPSATASNVLVWQELTHPEDARRAESTLFNYANGHTPNYENNYRLRRSDGDYVRVRETGAVAESDSYGKPRRIIAVQHVRSESDNHSRSTEKVHSTGLLALGLAHDLNNFLTVVNGYAALLLETPQPMETTKYLKLILNAGDLGAEITKRMLRFASNRETPHVVDMNQLGREVAELARCLLSRGVGVELELTAQLPQVLVDASLAEQALLNLVINARDALPNGGVIRLRTSNAGVESGLIPTAADVAPGTYLVISVIDTGTGMDAETLKHAFDPLFTTKPGGTGSGLGLWSARNFVNRSGGRIEIVTAPGKGTTVKMFLPVAAGPEIAGSRKRQQDG